MGQEESEAYKEAREQRPEDWDVNRRKSVVPVLCSVCLRPAKECWCHEDYSLSGDAAHLTETFAPLESTPDGIDAGAPGAKLDEGKAPVVQGVLHYFPEALRDVARLSKVGAEKYVWNGWQEVDDGINRYSDAMGRHMLDEATSMYDDGPTGTQLKHATCIAWNALARLELIIREEKARGKDA